MKDNYCTVDAMGQGVIPLALRRKYKIKAGTKVKILEEQFRPPRPAAHHRGLYIDRARGMLADGPDLLAIWEREHRAEGKHDK